MICASKDNRVSYDDIEKWEREIRSVLGEEQKPIFLVLTKSDTTAEDAQV